MIGFIALYWGKHIALCPGLKFEFFALRVHCGYCLLCVLPCVHINGCGLDNRKANLRPVTHAQNHQNRRKISGTTSRYKGVSWYKRRNRWHATIQINRKTKDLGYFEKEEDAAHAYDEAAKEAVGEFARLNGV